MNLVTKSAERAKVLVIGGGEKVQEHLNFGTPKIVIISIDIYASEHRYSMRCPLYSIKDNSFDGVWIQALLEHVVGLNKVVSEIYRVLKTDGIVYAETPLCSKCMKALFTRYTVLGHRYLFREFEMIEIGGNKGPDLVLVWSFRYFIWSLTK